MSANVGCPESAKLATHARDETAAEEVTALDEHLVSCRSCLEHYLERRKPPLAPDIPGCHVVKEIGPNGTFLQYDHTLAHFHDELFHSRMFDRLNWDAAFSQPVRGIEERAKAVAAELMRREAEPPLAPEQEQAIDEVVAEGWARRRELGQV